MSKKVDIGSKKFSELLFPLSQKPHKQIIKRIDSKMFSLDQNKVYNHNPEQLAFEEFSRCLDLFEKRNPNLSPLEPQFNSAEITKVEQPHREKLQQLAIETIREIYQVPSYVDLNGLITPNLNFDAQQNHNPEPFLNLTLDQKNAMRDEIKKREILNGLCHGNAMHIWKGVFHLVSEELDLINPSLKELYNQYTSTIGIGIWMLNPNDYQKLIEEGEQITLGLNKLKFDRKNGFGGQIDALAINFPVLLHELSKAVIDWLISGGIPKSYNDEELRYYYAKADNYQHEVYHYLLSPSLWTNLLEVAQVENKSIPKLISKLSKLSYNELVELFNLIQDNKEQAHNKIKSWRL